MKVARQVTMFAKRCGWSLQRHVNSLRARLTDCSAERRTSPRSNRHFLEVTARGLRLCPSSYRKTVVKSNTTPANGSDRAISPQGAYIRHFSKDFPRIAQYSENVLPKQSFARSRTRLPDSALHRTAVFTAHQSTILQTFLLEPLTPSPHRNYAPL